MVYSDRYIFYLHSAFRYFRGNFFVWEVFRRGIILPGNFFEGKYFVGTFFAGNYVTFRVTLEERTTYAL